MHKIHLTQPSVSAAEDLLVKLWLELERHQIETPDINAEFGSDGTVRFEFSFASSAHVLIIGNHIANTTT